MPITNPDPTPWLPEFTGNASEIFCLGCACELQFAMIKGLKVAACPQCQGVLVQRRELGPLIARCRSAWKQLDVAVAPMDATELDIDSHCPACGNLMETFAYAGPGSIAVDACSSCNMTWLDGGELERVTQAPGKREYRPDEMEPFDGSPVLPSIDIRTGGFHSDPRTSDLALTLGFLFG